MDRKEQLVEVLKRLNAGEPVERVKEEAAELLREIDSTELSLAEQQLIEEGMDPQELRALCVLHMEMLKDELEGLKGNLEAGHPLWTMIEEHDVILEFLEKLESLNHRVQGLEDIPADSGELEELEEIARGLLGAEKHHQREEEALFPVLEGRAITGPPRIMRLEHNDLRPRKEELLALVQEGGSLPSGSLKAKLDQLTKDIVFTLRDHIFKENHILYPTAYQNVVDGKEWERIKEICDQIGYCPFTPGSQRKN